MKHLFTYLCVLMMVNSFAQLTVKPNGSTDSYIYVQDQILFVTQDINLSKNANAIPATDITQASIYLRGEAQLIQSNDNAIPAQRNGGDGTLSVYQEGTTNKYDYNNWSSPVSVPITSGGMAISDGNGTFGASTLYTPFGKTDAGLTTLIGGYNSVESDGVIKKELEIPSYWFFYYPTGSDYQGWVHVQDDDYTIPAGYGYTMKGVTGADTFIADDYDGVANNAGNSQRYDFRGRPNSGTVSIGNTVAIVPGESVFIGNPYPSAIDLSYFLLEHSTNTMTSGGTPITLNMCTDLNASVTRKNNTTGVAYFWDSNPNVNSHYLVNYEGGYEAFTPVDCATNGMSVPATYFKYDETGTVIAGSDGSIPQSAVGRNRRYSPIAQGFIVETVSSSFSNTLAFENRHRLFSQEKLSAGTTFKNNTSAASSKRPIEETELIVIPKLRLNIEVNDTYTRQLALGFWPTATVDVDHAMDAKNKSILDTDAGFMHNNTSYVIDVRPFEVTDRIPLYLKLAEQADIKFTATSFENFDTEHVFIFDNESGHYYNVKHTNWSTTLAAGNYNGRFFLTFEEEEVLNTTTFAETNFDIFQNNNAAQLEIRNPNILDLKEVVVYDITGKQLIKARNLDGQAQHTFSTSNFAEAIYIVKIVTNNDVEIVQKITVSNKF